MTNKKLPTQVLQQNNYQRQNSNKKLNVVLQGQEVNGSGVGKFNFWI